MLFLLVFKSSWKTRTHTCTHRNSNSIQLISTRLQLLAGKLRKYRDIQDLVSTELWLDNQERRADSFRCHWSENICPSTIKKAVWVSRAKQVVDTCGHQMLSFLLDETLRKILSQVYVRKASKPLQNSKHLLQSLDSITLAHDGSRNFIWVFLVPTGSNWQLSCKLLRFWETLTHKFLLDGIQGVWQGAGRRTTSRHCSQ